MLASGSGSELWKSRFTVCVRERVSFVDVLLPTDASFLLISFDFVSLAFSTNYWAASTGHCGYVFGPLLIFTLFQPLICYYTLLQDSRWWQGLGGTEEDRPSPSVSGSIRYHHRH